jgi:Divergent InlB B-repeat domain
VAKVGQGTVVSTSPPSPVINCGATCSAGYPSGTLVTLAATPGAGWAFVGWGGACTGFGICTVTMDAAKSVTAIFVQQRS